jgi:hypothetical protein
MPYAAFFIVFAGSLAIAVIYPHLRVAASLVALGCAAILVAVFVEIGGIESARREVRITPDELTFSHTEFVEGPRFIRLAGRATNGSDAFTLRDFHLTATLYDCPALDSETADCTIIAQHDAIARVTVPPGQARDFDTVLGFADQPDPEGVPRWAFDVTRITATE